MWRHFIVNYVTLLHVMGFLIILTIFFPFRLMLLHLYGYMHFTLKIHFCLSNDISCGNPQYLNLNIHAIKCSKEMWDDDQLNCICTRYMLQIRMNKVLKWKKYVRKGASWNVVVGDFEVRTLKYWWFNSISQYF